MSEVSRERLVRAFEGLVDAMMLLEFLVFWRTRGLMGGENQF